MSDTCPHCEHPWNCHRGILPAPIRCHCGCMWEEPKPSPPPPTKRDQAINRLEDMLWTAFEAVAEEERFGPYVDREMDMIDASGGGVDMAAVAAHLYAAMHPVITESDQLHDLPQGSVVLDDDGDVFQRDDVFFEHEWFRAGNEMGLMHHGVRLPARVLWKAPTHNPQES